MHMEMHENTWKRIKNKWKRITHMETHKDTWTRIKKHENAEGTHGNA